MTRIRLTTGTDGAAQITVSGRGENLSPPTAVLVPPITAQLQGSNGECWTAEYDTAIIMNSGLQFKATPDL